MMKAMDSRPPGSRVPKPDPKVKPGVYPVPDITTAGGPFALRLRLSIFVGNRDLDPGFCRHQTRGRKRITDFF